VADALAFVRNIIALKIDQFEFCVILSFSEESQYLAPRYYQRFFGRPRKRTSQNDILNFHASW